MKIKNDISSREQLFLSTIKSNKHIIYKVCYMYAADDCRAWTGLVIGGVIGVMTRIEIYRLMREMHRSLEDELSDLAQ